MFETGPQRVHKARCWRRNKPAKDFLLPGRWQAVGSAPAGAATPSMRPQRSEQAVPTSADRAETWSPPTWSPTSASPLRGRRSGLQTEPLEADLRVAGPLKVTLHVSTTAQIRIGGEADRRLSADFPIPNPPQQAGPAASSNGGYQQCSAASLPRQVSTQL